MIFSIFSLCSVDLIITSFTFNKTLHLHHRRNHGLSLSLPLSLSISLLILFCFLNHNPNNYSDRRGSPSQDDEIQRNLKTLTITPIAEVLHLKMMKSRET